MSRLGHASMATALVYQHATGDRDDQIAGHLDSLIVSAVPAEVVEPVVELRVVQ